MLPLALLAIYASACKKEEQTDANLQADHAKPLNLYAQETSEWCWAASGKMIMEAYGVDLKEISQCRQAKYRFGKGDCPCDNCKFPSPSSTCILAGWPEFERYGFSCKRTTNGSALSWDALVEELKAGPVAFSWKAPGGSGHMMVAIETVSGPNGTPGEVVILDPAEKCQGTRRPIPYSDYVNGEKNYNGHWYDFYQIQSSGIVPAVIPKLPCTQGTASEIQHWNNPTGKPLQQPKKLVGLTLRGAVKQGFLPILPWSLPQNMAPDAAFQEAEDFASAKMGFPLELSVIRLDALKNYTRRGKNEQDRDPAPLLDGTGDLLYPLSRVDGAKRFLGLRRWEDRLELRSLGDSERLRTLITLRDSLVRKDRAPEAISWVSIPAFHLEFLGYREDGKVVLRLASGKNDFGFTSEEAISLEDVLTRLGPAIERHNGLPV